MDKIVNYMINKEWGKDEAMLQKRYLLNLVRTSYSKSDIASQIGCILIYNQIIEQFLKEIIELSINYIKAEIWPTEIELKIDFKGKTFGRMIDMFNQYAVKEIDRDDIIGNLGKYNSMRNKVVHNLFTIQNIEQLTVDLNEYVELAEKILFMLLNYNTSICCAFEDLSRRVDFECFID